MSESETAPLSVERRDQVAIITIQREARRNALSRATLEAFAEAGQELCLDTELRAVIITGAGDKAFCAGADLKEKQELSEEQIRDQLWEYRSKLGWIDPCPVPVIAAINGVALGGGLELALMCDLRIAAPHAVLGLPETSLGIIPGAEGTQRLPQLIGEARAKELILLGTRIDAKRAYDYGLVNRVSPDGASFLDDVWQWIEPIRQGAPVAQLAALEAIDGARNRSLADGSALEVRLYERTLKSDDRREALAAFAEKRKPVFRGR
jgi:enoyl-CoA hydratase/carnithine racemase